MTSFHLTLDPPAVAQDRVELDLNSGPILIGGTSPGNAPDWGDAAIQAYMADMQWGSATVDFRVPNRMVKIPLFLGCGAFASEPDAILAEEAARVLLQQKVGLLQREGGWLLRQRDNGPAMYADIVNATLTLPDVWGETGGVEPDVVLTLECLPDFYGDEITLDSVAATGVCTVVAASGGDQAVIGGDYPARCRIILTDASGNDQLGLLWGMRSKHYDSAATAKLVYEAEALTPLDAATTHVHAGASGGSTMRHNSLPGGSWCPVLLTDLLTGAAGLTHTGSYRIWARAYSATATPRLRLLWGVGDVAHPVTNEAIALPGAANFYPVDLGEVRLDAPPTGAYKWHGVIQALAAVQNDPVEIDCLYLQPLDEVAGRLSAIQTPSVLGVGTMEPAGAGADDASIGTAAWTNPGNITQEDLVTAFASLGPAAITHYLKSSGHGFAIPAGATITGIQVDIKRSTGALYTIVDNRVSLAKAGAVQATNKGDTVTPWPRTWPSSTAFKSYGGETDLWGTTWTPADINNAGFGAALSATNSSGPSGVPNVDFVRITVFYSTAGAIFGTAEDAVCYASRSAELRTDGMFRQDSTGTVEGTIAQVIGDLPRLPPSGIEDRPVELFVKPTRGDLASEPDAALDPFTVQTIYRPCWLSRP